MGHQDTGLGHKLGKLGCCLLNGLHPVVEVEYLPVSLQFPKNSFSHHVVTVLGDEGLDWEAGLGGCVHGAKVPYPSQCQVEGAWYRRGAQGQHIHLLPKLL